MDLISSVKQACERAGKIELQQYVQLLRSDAGDKAATERMLSLMGKLCKTPDMVRDDQRALDQAVQLRAKIDAGREASPHIAGAKQAIREHDGQTREIAGQREAERKRLWGEAAPPIAAVEKGEAAIRELAKLKAQYADVLADVIVDTPESLRAAAEAK